MKVADALLRALDGKRLLIFDFDGTVADTSPLHEAAFVKVLAPRGVKVDYQRIAGLKTLDAVRACFAATGEPVTDSELDALVGAKQQCVREMIRKALDPLPGVDGFLRWAKGRYRLAMATSGSSGTVGLALQKLGYTGWFEPLVCADDVSRSKPAPDLFLEVLRQASVPAHECLVFEDSSAGIRSAEAAKLQVIDVKADGFAWLDGGRHDDSH